MLKKYLAFQVLSVLFLAVCGYAHAAGPVLFENESEFIADAYYFDKYFQKERLFAIKGAEIMVRFDVAADGSDIQSFSRRYNLTVLHELEPNYRHAHFALPDGTDILSQCNRMSKEKGVLSAYPVLMGNDGYHKPIIGHELTVQFNRSLSESACLAIIRSMGSTVTEDHWTPGYYTMTVPDGMTLFEAIRSCNARKDVRFAEFSLIGFDDAVFIPNDDDFPNQQNLNNTGQVGSCVCPPYDTHDIRAVDGWEISRGNPNVVVSIIDTGMDLDHPDLADNLLERGSEDWDFSSTSSDIPEDTSGHGTSCSGIAAGVTNNGIGIAGVAHLCKLMPLKIDLSSGQNQNRADAINYAASRRPLHDGLVLSNSWRMSSGEFTAVYNAIEYAKSEGCVVVFAAGNGNGSPVEAPSDSEHCICVSAVSPCDELKNYSSCDGESWGSSYGDAVDVCAPGVLIHTTAMGGGYTQTFNGTSSACPHVAGVCALILSVAPGISPDDVQTILQNGCDDLGAPGWDNQYGHGRINIANILSLVSGVYLDKSMYMCEDTVGIIVRDSGASSSVDVHVSSDTEQTFEIVTLAENPGEPGVFEGTITASEIPPVTGDGIISVVHGDGIQADYIPLGKMVTSSVDCIQPDISNVQITQIGYESALITWDTDEDADSVVHYGVGTPDQIVALSDYIMSHQVLLTGLDDCTNYLFYVESSDPAGNTAMDDNYGLNYTFLTLELVVLLEEPLDADPGWTISGGLWAFGQPTGGGGSYGDPDPTSGYTGEYVYGYNLNGDYTDNMPAYYLTTNTFDCSEAMVVFLSFYRWLGVESNSWDHAVISISNNNGSSWTPIWENPGSSMSDGDWIRIEHDISALAAGYSQVQVRWQMGTTDTSVVYCGWNIDDILIFYSRECTSVTPTPTPTNTPIPPTDTPVPPTDTPVPPTDTPVPPTDTPAPPTETPVPPTDTPEPTNTHIPTFTPVPSTETPVPPTDTPVPSTHTPMPPTGTPVPPTWTPECSELGCEVFMPKTDFTAGDECYCRVYVCNPGSETYVDVPVFAILDVYGLLFFAPSFGDFDCYTMNVTPGMTTIDVLPVFTWPAGAGSASGINWYAAMTDSEITKLFGRFDMFTFGWH
ncbi:S8 family serine peptidase [bacterium]|nr:S8 family serine peptidase [candidate division CSSED10-310 bacterium]